MLGRDCPGLHAKVSMADCTWVPFRGLVPWAEGMRWERVRLKHLKGKLYATRVKRAENGETWLRNNNKPTALATSFQTFSPSFPHLVQISHPYCFLRVLESSVHVPFSYSWNGFSWILDLNQTFTNSQQPWHEFPLTPLHALEDLLEDCTYSLGVSCLSDHTIQSRESDLGQQTLCLIESSQNANKYNM